MEEKREFLKIKNLKKSFDSKIILKNIKLTLCKNKIHTILGPSGSGKTTLLNIISGMKTHDAGVIEFLEKPVISYLFQEDRLLKWMTVYKNIEIILKEVFTMEQTKELINKYLYKLNLYEYKNHYPEQLSGGMRQRVSAIRAFLYPSNLLLMDEAFKSLDIKIKKKLVKTVIDLWKENPKTILFVTHDVREALLISDNIYLLSDTPTEIIKSYKIDDTVYERDLSKEYYLKLEADIYKYLS